MNPPGFGSVVCRKVFIPQYPHDPAKGGVWYTIDLRPLFNINDSTLLWLQQNIPLWAFTLREYAEVSALVVKNVARVKLDQYREYLGESERYVKEYVLPSDYDWVYYKTQLDWLKNAVGTLVEVILPLVRTSSADRRKELPNS